MKIALIKDTSEIINGYKNILNKDLNELALDDYLGAGIDLVQGDYLDFTNISFDGEADEVIIPSLIEQIPSSEITKYLEKWIRITSIGGTISIGGVDIFEVLNAMNIGKFNEQELNSLLYPKQSCYSAKQVEYELTKLGLEIDCIKILGYNYLVLAKRVK